MHADLKLAPSRATSRGILVRQLISLAEESDRAELRPETSMLVAMAYAVFDGEQLGGADDQR